MTDTDKRCGTCRYFDPWGGRFGFCDWQARRQDAFKLPCWLQSKADRHTVDAYWSYCDAWEPPK